MAWINDDHEGKAVFCSTFFLQLYRLIDTETVRSRLRRLVVSLEGGPAYSRTIRSILKQFYRLDVGLYTAGPCRVRPKLFQQGTTIGRYSSVADTVRTFTRNHPMNTRSSHGAFYNPAIGIAKKDPAPFARFNLTIGHGVWIGHNAIILLPAETIGHGAVIAAGSVVCANVPPYAIVSGFPARVTGYRFSKEVIAQLLTSKWWELTPGELRARRREFQGILRRCDAPTDPTRPDLASHLR